MNEMMTKVFDYLKQQGLVPTEEEFGISFKYQMADFLILSDDDDQQFFRLAMPGIYSCTPENRLETLEAINVTNNDMKVIKASIFGETNVWLFFEQLLDSTPVFNDIIPRGINILLAGQQKFFNALKELE
ncbi:MAG: hypothetical protein PUC21_01065 [Bacteroidales bacterium]|nr:hypothetical protein [Bacteroidales bacterium]MDY2932030.1 hypothetical protein [Muribaculaceae bacterium]MDD6131206.1 hypothetical protein [Bacteroidales bacterium]MDD6851131.1 hypothetical protein [Bacteroidales bacterium]MDD7404671.1 hypothetical protein [Bacteroidales bacterium]